MKGIRHHLVNIVFFAFLLLFVTCSKEKVQPVSTIEVTTAIGTVSMTSIVCSGEITSNGVEDIKERGVCFDTLSNPELSDGKVTAGSGPGSFTVEIAGLAPGKAYYVRAYTKTDTRVVYGTEFKTITLTLASVNATAVTAITTTSATVHGEVVADGGAAVTERGVCWNVTPAPTISNSVVSSGQGEGSFSVNITGLDPGKKYYAKVYATTYAGTAYSNELEFTTLNTITVPTVITSHITDITQVIATGGGNVISDGGAPVTTRGICYSDGHPLPSLETSNTRVTVNGSGIGEFTSSLINLYGFTWYSVRAYATNSAGTGYGDVVVFNTPPFPQIPPLPITPADGVTVGCCRVNFTWQTSVDAEYSMLQIARSADFSGATYNADITCGGSERIRTTGVFSYSTGYREFCVRMDDPSLNGVWYWRVRTGYAGATSAWSQTRSFTFQN